MNALEQEYRDNVERTHAREDRRMLVLYAIGGALVIGACVWRTNAFVMLFAAPFVVAESVARWRRHLALYNPPEVENESVPCEVGYREAPRQTRRKTPAANTTGKLQIGIGVFVMLGALGTLAWNWDHVGSRFVANMVTVVGMFVVIAIQRVHAAWKRRHDAKLMLEWERRLEEMK